VTHPRKKFRR